MYFYLVFTVPHELGALPLTNMARLHAEHRNQQTADRGRRNEYVSFRVKEYRAGGKAAIETIRGTEFLGRFLPIDF